MNSNIQVKTEQPKSMPWRLSLVLVVSLLFGYCTNKGVEPNDPGSWNKVKEDVVESDNIFGLKLFGEIIKEQQEANVFISPLSVAIALGMAYNGANGATRDSMQKTLELTGLDLIDVNETYQNLMALLVHLDPKVQFTIANSIWYRQGFHAEENFLTLNKTYFNAKVEALDFNDPGAADIINNWVSESTNQRIKKVVANPIDPLLIMYLINAIYFKGDWSNQFDKDNTTDATFTTEQGAPASCKMMSIKDDFAYAETSEFQMIDLPYGDSIFTMTVLLPDSSTTADNLIAQMSKNNWDAWVGSLSTQEVQLYLPKFKLEYELEMRKALAALGMGIAFEPDLADFTNINKDMALYISQVKHKTFVQVDEEGTEAAAVTVVGIGTTSAPPQPKVMHVDRPFVFVIREKRAGSILFVGKIVEPVWEN